MNRVKLLAGILFILICLVIVFGHTNAQVSDLNYGIIAINSSPTGASVTIDGKVIPGITPLKIQVPLGVHTYRVTLKGYADWEGIYTNIGSSTGFYAILDNRYPDEARYLYLERKPAFINLLTTGYIDGWWSTTSDVLQIAVGGQDRDYLYNYDLQKQTIINTDLPQTALTDPAMRQTLGLPPRNGDSIFTAAYRSPSNRYILQAQLLDQTNFTFVLKDTTSNRIYTTSYQYTSGGVFGGNESSNNPTWSSNERLVWLNADSHRTDPTVLWLQNDLIKTVQFQTDTDGGMYTRPSSQGYALVWNKNYYPDGSSYLWRNIYLTDLSTMKSQILPLTSDDVPNPTALTFSPDGQWIYAGTKKGIKRIDIHNLSDVELIDSTLSEANLYKVISFSYTLHYALVSGQGANSTEFIYKLPNLDALPAKTPTITPSTATPTGGSAPGGNQVGG